MPREKLEIYVERKNGGVALSAIYGGYRHHKFYIGYTLKDAKADFRGYVKMACKLG